MLIDLIRSNFPHKGWDTLIQVLGEPPALQQARTEASDQRRKLEALSASLKQAEAGLAQARAEADKAREERLTWMGREAATRKELQDAQERNKDLLEQVVRLTHQKREAAKDLLDQKFKTEATPLERNRFEMELTEARGTVRRAEERVRQAEEQAAIAKKRAEDALREAAVAKRLAEELDSAKRQSRAHLAALAGAIQRIQQYEMRLNKLEQAEQKLRIASAELRSTQQKLAALQPRAQLKARAKARTEARTALPPAKRSYRKPLLLGVTEEQRAAFGTPT
jgi:chromosome segregation ATPase